MHWAGHILAMTVLFGQAPPQQDAAVDVEIMLATDKPQVNVGDPIRIQETIPVSSNLRVAGVKHQAMLIGRYNASSQSVTYLDKHDFKSLSQSDLDRDFAGLGWFKAYYHGMVFDVETMTRKGTVYVCHPKAPGVYLLSAAWKVQSTQPNDEWITAPPIVLTVRPKKATK